MIDNGQVLLDNSDADLWVGRKDTLDPYAAGSARMTLHFRMAKGAGMRTWNRHLRDNRRLAALLVALALCMKALVPAGYMIGASSKILTVQICADASGVDLTQSMAIPLDRDAGQKSDHGKEKATCAWSGLAKASNGSTDLALLALALAFILALGLLWQTPPPRTASRHIRPPLRGPPLPA